MKNINLRSSKRIYNFIYLISSLTTYSIFTTSAQALTCMDSPLITPVSFGVYDPAAGNNLASPGGISINKFFNCLTLQPVSTSFTVKLSTGSSGTYSNRKMTNLANPLSSLQYNLYTSNGSGSTVWGDGSGGSSVVSQEGSSNINIPIYGVVPVGQNPAMGSYSDTVTVTIEFN